jgi:hypothetical protein
MNDLTICTVLDEVFGWMLMSRGTDAFLIESCPAVVQTLYIKTDF